VCSNGRRFLKLVRQQVQEWSLASQEPPEPPPVVSNKHKRTITTGTRFLLSQTNLFLIPPCNFFFQLYKSSVSQLRTRSIFPRPHHESNSTRNTPTTTTLVLQVTANMSALGDVSSQIDPATDNNYNVSNVGTSDNAQAAQEHAAGLAEAAKNSEVCTGRFHLANSSILTGSQ